MPDQTYTTNDDGMLLPGLDGTNPLGFLAAIGLFRLAHLHSEGSGVRLRWTPQGGTWIPSLIGRGTMQDVLDFLEDNLTKTIDEHPVHILSSLTCRDNDDLNARRKWFADRVQVASLSERVDTDWLASFSSDAVQNEATNQLQVVRRDYFANNLKSIIANTNRGHLERAIFSPWDYADPLANQSLHFDPDEDRRHAYRWNKPSGDPDLKKAGGMLGANRLAIEAFPLFLSVPDSETLHTTGFTGHRKDNTRWTWPIWQIPVSLTVLQSLLMMRELQEENLTDDTRRMLRQRGIVAVLRTRRILVEKTPNFTPPRRIA